MPRYEEEVLLGYQPALEYPNPDQPDSHEQPCTLIWKSPERDPEGDPYHVVRVPCSPAMRVAIAAALMAQEAPDPGLTPETATADAIERATRCARCGAREGESCQFIEAQAGWSDSDYERAAESGCRDAIAFLEAGPV